MHKLFRLFLLFLLCDLNVLRPEKNVVGSRGTGMATAIVLVLVLVLDFSSFQVI